jgi:hypothetical protein
MGDLLRSLTETYAASPSADGAYLIAKAHFDLTLFRAAAKWAAESLAMKATEQAHSLRIEALRHTNRTRELEAAERELARYLPSADCADAAVVTPSPLVAPSTAAATPAPIPTPGDEPPQETIRRLKPLLDRNASDADAALELASAHLQLDLFRAGAKLAEQSIAHRRSAKAFFVAASAYVLRPRNPAPGRNRAAEPRIRQ